MEKIFSYAWKGKRGISSQGPTNPNNSEEPTEPGKERPKEGAKEPDMGAQSPTEAYVDDEQGLQRRHSVDTLLTVHFFGKKGTNELKYEGFRGFMENLQTEVLELEFHEFSKGIFSS